MSPKQFPLNDSETKEWLRRVGLLSEEDALRIISTIKFNEDHLQTLAIKVDAVLNPVAGDGRFPSLCGFSLWKKRRSEDPQLKVLYAQQEATRHSNNMLRSLLAPIRRLPSEILSEIFKFCLPREKFIRPAAGEAPLLLTQICAAWRDVCISNAVLWSSLEIVNKNPDTMQIDPDHRRNITALLNMWFSRAGHCLLSFSVQDDNILIKNVAETVGKLAPRWRHLRFNIPEDTCLSIPPSNNYSALETFEIYTPEGLDVCLVEDLSGALLNAPNLWQFIWDNGDRRPSPIDLHWTNLTRLTLNTSINIAQCLTIMSMLTGITHLTFQDITMSTCILSRRDIILPELTSFVICAECSMAPVFEEITLPKLEELVLNIKTWSHSSLINFLRRSRCPLESLNLYFPPLTETELIECLEIVQNTLKEFTVQGTGNGIHSIGDCLLDRLTDNGKDDVLCPKVVVIALYECISCSPGHFARMVESRLTPPSPSIDSDGSSEAKPRPTISPIRVIEMYDNEPELEELKTLQSMGLITKVYSNVDGTPLELEPEEIERLRTLREEGLIRRVYSPTAGTFGDVD
ncbi:hypothetical protein GALMADRAFT_267841 [Galerina marginata CBS 339.88]|uniref:Uncharacterized protein n=1 Tax=Galerina marginata (strain CBS 339.88) TaxID=685588 RepID=A0A067SZ77_GALM3|nr:hypothetical protein GALMADRAFT_267841 [Galerina marginata CBS 339.88]